MHQKKQLQVRGNIGPGSSTDMAGWRPLLAAGGIQCKTRVSNSRPKGREKEPSSGQRRAVQVQLGLGPGVRSLALSLQYGITRGVLSLTCPMTPALGHTLSLSATPDPPLAGNS